MTDSGQQEIVHTFAQGFGGLFGCGTSMITLIFALGVSMLVNFYFVKTFFAMLKDARAAKTSVQEVQNVIGKN